MLELSWTALAGLSAMIFISGVIDSLAGGGGLIALPSYLAVGVPPGLALGTNKLGSTPGVFVSAFRYVRRLKLSFKDLAPLVLLSAIGSWIGASLVILLDPAWIFCGAVTACKITAACRDFSPKGIKGRQSA